MKDQNIQTQAKSKTDTATSQQAVAGANGASITPPDYGIGFFDRPNRNIALQRKLAIGASDDPLEREADQVADQVMRMPDSPLIQRKCADCEEDEKDTLHRKPLAASITPFIQTKGAEGSTASDTVTSKINATKGSGNKMDNNIQTFMQSRFVSDFSDVKIHTGGEAIQMNRELNAKAFTVSNDIYFNEGQYNPNSSNGKHLLAHELTHVMQNKTNEKADVKRQTSTPVPSTAHVDPATQIATFSINSVNIVVEPDQTVARGTSVRFHGERYTVNRSGALTVFYLRPHIAPSFTRSGRNRKVSSVALTFTMYIKTFFGTSASASDISAYGRGTTTDDVAAGNTSLGFHEGNHGQDFQDYISQNPLPQITLAVPASMRAYIAAVNLFNREIQTYSNEMNDYTHTNTDMVGTPQP